MELCTGGSLFNLLDDPENSYGLDEVTNTYFFDWCQAGSHEYDLSIPFKLFKP